MHGKGGPFAERSEERMVGREGLKRGAPGSPSPPRPLRGAVPLSRFAGKEGDDYAAFSLFSPSISVAWPVPISMRRGFSASGSSRFSEMESRPSASAASVTTT
jgi:hypothetical protein